MAGLAHRGRQSGAGIIVDVDKGDFRTLRREMHDFRCTDPARAAGYEHDPAAQARIHREHFAHVRRSMMARTVSSGEPAISTVIGFSSGPGSSRVLNWLSSNAAGMKWPFRAFMRSA